MYLQFFCILPPPLPLPMPFYWVCPTISLLEETEETTNTHTPVSRCNSYVPRFSVVTGSLFLCVIYARLSLVPHQGCAISSLSVTCKVDALWAARQTRHWTLISLSAWCLQAPRVSSLPPLSSDGGSSRKIHGGSLGTSVGIYQRTEERSASSHILCPLVARGCRTLDCQCSRTVVAPPVIHLFDPLCILPAACVWLGSWLCEGAACSLHPAE